MLDRGQFWTPVPEQGTELTVVGLTVTVARGLHQLLLSGDRRAISELLGTSFRRPVGFNETAVGEMYGAALARDRTLIVSERPLGFEEGWIAASSIAATIVDDAWLILDLEGDGLDDLVSMATTIDRSDLTPSSALLFAAIPCLAYRYGSPKNLRLHVERPLASFVIEWVQRTMMDRG